MTATTVRENAKRAAGASGLVSLYRRRQARGHLTVVTLHRVLAAGDPRWAGADPRYTITDTLLADLVGCLARGYDLVSKDDVVNARNGDAALPARPLLLTIDDGWADTEQYAMPVLRRSGCPALVFVTSGAVGRRHGFWQERLFSAWRRGEIHPDAAPGIQDEAGIRRLIATLRPMEPEARADMLNGLLAADPERTPEMVDVDGLRRLAAGGMAIGAHGVSHEPMAEGADARWELREPRRALARMLAIDDDEIDTVSFPHGSYDDSCLAEARTAGYRLIFTSDTRLTPLTGGRLENDVIGRIGIPSSAVCDAAGALRPELLSLWLARRPRVA
jgi:peptidoglycan/xylan/chitin deacetylase (PgdA/CDA1 family)